ncbi:Uncharacterized protein FWK35_00010494 [Aphis craccivora]|uniref:Uncharacterized protein n=1 Tax=Aphis craccivora TaxID=307492 RepID=A0A6G0YZ64_APHCR|nr:Uncharacterized protein FWK35_00010494 [Aphis craccivora]
MSNLVRHLDLKREINTLLPTALRNFGFLGNILSGAMNVLILQCCVLCVYVYTKTYQIMLQFQTLGVVSGGKMNQFSKAPGKTKKKIKEKRKFLRKTSFRPNRFFYMVVIQKLITVNTCNFHQIFMSVVGKKNLDDQKLRVENLIQGFSQNLNFGVFRPLKHKPPLSPTIGNYILD